MELYYIIAISDRAKSDQMLDLFNEHEFSTVLGNLGVGTATSEHLLLHALEKTEKAILSTVASRSAAKRLFKDAEEKLHIDIPGNGIMISLPLKSVGGGRSLSVLTQNQDLGGGRPAMDFKHELIIAIINEGHSDDVMDAARTAGAGGGTVIHAKGTGGADSEKFMGLSLAQGKDMIYIVATSEKKTAIMQAISRECGKGTPAEAVTFSLPVSAVTGIRQEHRDILEDEGEK